MIIRAATTNDIPGILRLQEKYLVVNMPPELRADGFVTTRFTTEQVQELITFGGAFIADDNSKIVAYVLCGSWEFYSQWPIFAYMITRFPNLQFRNHKITTENSFQYGPICIDKANRGSDLLYELFEATRIALSKRYVTGVTFINKANKRSYDAHTKKLDLIVIDEFSFNDNEYYGLAFDTAASVLM